MGKMIADGSMDAIETHVRQAVNAAIEREIVVGCSLRISIGRSDVVRVDAGWSDRERKARLGDTAIFRFASLSKLVTMTAFLGLVSAGKMGVDDPIEDYLPWFRPRLATGRIPQILLRHLVTHTAGLDYGFLEDASGPYHTLGVSDGMDDSEISLEENVRRIACAPLLFPPGTDWRYSVAIDVLGLAIEAATGQRLADIISQYVSAPLEMRDTGFLAADPTRLVTAYIIGEPPARMSSLSRHPFAVSTLDQAPGRAVNAKAFASAGAGMVGSADDFLRLLFAIRRREVPGIDPALMSEMVVNTTGDREIFLAGPGWGWSLAGLVLLDPKAAGTPAKPGTWRWGGLFGNHFFVDPKAELCVAVLTNTAVAGTDGEFPDMIRKAVYAGLEVRGQHAVVHAADR